MNSKGSQIYQLVWQEYPHGDITNIIYCMVHRLKRKLKNVDVNAEHIIISVKAVSYTHLSVMGWAGINSLRCTMDAFYGTTVGNETVKFYF